uniref:Putative salivary lipocalin n=1 Tax=Ixodes ricinus TaxID=34613 RepID=A0A0K8RME8_IXORI
MDDANPLWLRRNMKAVTFLLPICFWFTCNVMAYNKTEIDDRPDCKDHQDINKALQNVDPFSWMFRRTYLPQVGDPEYACVYANVTKLKNHGEYVFKQGWTDANNQTIEIPLFVKTEKTTEYKRETDNAMRVTLRYPNGTIIKDFGLYKLIFSDYEKCDILRVTSKGQACELYVHSKHLKEEELEECLRYYRHACVKEGVNDYKVYHENCKTHQTPKLAATPLPQ